MSYDPINSPKQMEGWLLAISEVLAVMLTGDVSEEDRERCRDLLRAWSKGAVDTTVHVEFPTGPGRDHRLPGREALPALFALLDKK